MPITTASTTARRRCRWASPAGPLMYFECPVTVAMRPSIDWPSWPTTTMSSIAPRRSGSNILSHGAGSAPFALRNRSGTTAQPSWLTWSVAASGGAVTVMG